MSYIGCLKEEEKLVGVLNYCGPQGRDGEAGPQGPQGPIGPAGPTGAEIVSTVLIGTDPQGGNIYQQTFDNGETATFTAPKGAKGDAGGVITWNTRDGNVSPEMGDYNLNMVGAVMLTNTEIDDMWNI